MKHIFIINPNNQSKIENIIVKVMQGYQYEIKYTQYPRHATKIASNYYSCHYRIYAVGGDGLIHEIVQGLAGSDNELVVIPMGTGNDFIRTIANSHDPQLLLEQSLKLKAQPIDLIQANDIYCINVLCCAFDSDIANNVHNYKQIRLLPRSLQYVNVLLHRVFKYHLSLTKVSLNGEKLYENKLLLGAFCNGQYFGGGFKIGKYANVQNGLIDINLVPKLPGYKISYYLSLLLTERLEKGKLYYHNQLERVTLESWQEVNIDGEVYPPGTYQLRIVKNQLKVVLFTKN